MDVKASIVRHNELIWLLSVSCITEVATRVSTFLDSRTPAGTIINTLVSVIIGLFNRYETLSPTTVTKICRTEQILEETETIEAQIHIHMVSSNRQEMLQLGEFPVSALPFSFLLANSMTHYRWLTSLILLIGSLFLLRLKPRNLDILSKYTLMQGKRHLLQTYKHQGLVVTRRWGVSEDSGFNPCRWDQHITGERKGTCLQPSSVGWGHGNATSRSRKFGIDEFLYNSAAWIPRVEETNP